jgi:hypothetical protein
MSQSGVADATVMRLAQIQVVCVELFLIAVVAIAIPDSRGIE